MRLVMRNPASRVCDRISDTHRVPRQSEPGAPFAEFAGPPCRNPTLIPIDFLGFIHHHPISRFMITILI